MIDTSVGAFLKRKRLEQALDFAYVAKQCLCTSPHLLAIENGGKALTEYLAKKLATMYELTPSERKELLTASRRKQNVPKLSAEKEATTELSKPSQVAPNQYSRAQQ